MMMTEVANHSKRNHTDSYFSGKQAVATSSGSEEFVGMGSKKPRNASPRGGGGPISPKVLLALHIELFACELDCVLC
jgi:hypothetical protein